MKNKKVNAWDILDKVWDKFESYYETDLSELKDASWQDFVNSCCPAETEEYIKVAALEHFLFEVKYLVHKPNRNTMKWLWGEHVMLYDVYGCSIHKFQCVTSDSYDKHIDGLTVFCPVCNADKMINDRKDKYENDVKGVYLTDEEWNQALKISKWHKDYNRRVNFKYTLKKWINPSYAYYRIVYEIKKLLKRS
jgi:hypothetical protein